MPALSILLLTNGSATTDKLHTTLISLNCQVRTVDRLRCGPHEICPTPHEVILMDLPQPAARGLIWCRELRNNHSNCRLCVLFESAQESEQVGALELGADVVLVHPFGDEHLVAQLVALSRSRTGQSPVFGPELQIGDLRIDLQRRSTSLATQPIDLTDSEFDLLLLLARNVGVVLTRDRIQLEIRGFPHDGLDRSIDLRVARLRRKLGDDARHPRIIKSVRGRGYFLAPPSI